VTSSYELQRQHITNNNVGVKLYDGSDEIQVNKDQLNGMNANQNMPKNTN